MVAFCLCFLLAGPATVADVQGNLHGLLSGGEATSAEVQRALGLVLGWTVQSEAGVIAAGRSAVVNDVPIESVQKETHSEAPILRAFDLTGQGPEPIRVQAPVPKKAGAIEVYRRGSPGMYVRVEPELRPANGYVAFSAKRPGRFAVREVDAFSHPDLSKLSSARSQVEPGDKGLQPLGCLGNERKSGQPPLSTDPAAKKDWRLYRVVPEQATGPIPLILLSGVGSDRWANFIHWAANSPEAEAFRTEYQLWDFYRPIEGINTAIGFSAEYPGFEESIVAYLYRFIIGATEDGVDTDGVRHYLPDGPLAMLAHSHGGLVARAFLKHCPDIAERTVAVVTVDSPHLGTPFATPEWLRQTVSRLGFSSAKILGLTLEATAARYFLTDWISTGRQSDMDLGWGNFDAAGGYGLPYERFRVLRPCRGLVTLTVSPRDANQTGARMLSGFNDRTFEPAEVLTTYCGGMDEIMPSARGELHLDKFFVYGAYLVPGEDLLRQLSAAVEGELDPWQSIVEALGLRVTHSLMNTVETPSTDAPLGAYFLGDGVVPLQSQLLLDGAEGTLLYETKEVFGWRLLKQPPTPRMDIIMQHTLADPNRLRILRGWSHLDTINGRYNKKTGHSELFYMVANDLLSVAGGQAQ